MTQQFVQYWPVISWLLVAILGVVWHAAASESSKGGFWGGLFKILVAIFGDLPKAQEGLKQVLDSLGPKPPAAPKDGGSGVDDSPTLPSAKPPTNMRSWIGQRAPLLIAVVAFWVAGCAFLEKKAEDPQTVFDTGATLGCVVLDAVEGKSLADIAIDCKTDVARVVNDLERAEKAGAMTKGARMAASHAWKESP